MAEVSLPKWLPWVGTALAALGVADSIYLTIDHFAKRPLACPETGIINCTKVTNSQYSDLWGIPLPLLGLAFFIVMLVLQTPWAWKLQQSLVRKVRLLLAVSGIGMVIWLIYIELFKLDAICLYCTAVHVLTVLVFALTAYGTALLADD